MFSAASPTGPQTWRRAFLRQARADMACFDALKGQPLCQQLHYLQMAAEKMAKSLMTPATGDRPPAVHNAIVRFIKTSRSMPLVMRASRMRREQYRAYALALQDVASKLEDLAPSGSQDKPNPEYPWKGQGKIISPLDYEFGSLQLGNTKMMRLVQFIRMCLTVE